MIFREGYTSYKEREGWQDIEPLSQDDGPNPVVPIAYAPEYIDTMDYFRAIAKKDELSSRALEITTEVIKFNPSHYTVWLYRQKIISNLDIDLNLELDFIDELVVDNPKCYQLWQHRQFIVEKLNDYSAEDAFLKEVFEEDSKNFHAWSYRQWLIKKFELWATELSFCNEMLTDDIRNNSAWNQRFFILTQNPNQPLDDATILKETQYVIEKIQYVPFNQPPYNYIKGLYNKFYDPPTRHLRLKELADNLTQLKIRAKSLYAWYIDIALDSIKFKNVDNSVIQEGIQMCDKLIASDITRKKYWEFKRGLLTKEK